jgi:thymidylate kinase
LGKPAGRFPAGFLFASIRQQVRDSVLNASTPFDLILPDRYLRSTEATQSYAILLEAAVRRPKANHQTNINEPERQT